MAKGALFYVLVLSLLACSLTAQVDERCEDLAVHRGDVKALRTHVLGQAGYNINGIGEDGWAALMVAALDAGVVRFLADDSLREDFGTALDLAEILLEEGADAFLGLAGHFHFALDLAGHFQCHLLHAMAGNGRSPVQKHWRQKYPRRGAQYVVM
ncbi:hypothetical protein T484DRAFT_1743819 [Baffinella frigidus]|nr:hypothetical protein T484DRAFT_1743819 [Cryptophyta sp. CCMP2293]